MRGDVVAGVLAGCGEAVGVVEQLVGNGGKIGTVVDSESAFTGYQVESFFEPGVIGPEDDWQIIHGSFGDVVNAGAESTAYIGQCTIAIYGGKQPEAVDDEAIACGYLMSRGSCIAYERAL